jgi:hypothetical protein
MTVKCLPENEKQEIAELYAAKLCSSDDLAQVYSVSRRTINRVLVEMGVARTRVHKGRTVVEPIEMASPADPGPKPVELHIDMIELTFMEKVRCLFKAIFWPTKQQNNVQPRT